VSIVPKLWDITSLGTKYPIEPMFCLPMTMETNMMMAIHDNTLPTPFPLPLAEASTSWQYHNIKIIQGVDQFDASNQHDMQCGMHTPSNNLQLPNMLPHVKSKNQGHSAQHNDLQCQVPGGKPTHPNNIIQKVTPIQKHQNKPLYNYPIASPTTTAILTSTKQLRRPWTAQLLPITNTATLALQLM